MPAVRRRGFTLIELLIVIAIISLFMFLLVPMVVGMRKKAQVANTRARMMSLSLALNDYYTDFREYIAPPLFQYLWLGDGVSGTPGKISHFDRTLRPASRERYLDVGDLPRGGPAAPPAPYPAPTGGMVAWITDFWGGPIYYVVTPSPAPPLPPQEPQYTLQSYGPDQITGSGDANGDGDVDSLDDLWVKTKGN
ncbi:MAG: type II secretion system protein [Planctomycetes bacterium]|nr:type II secretion system protein [Planctomycetota bacterium]